VWRLGSFRSPTTTSFEFASQIALRCPVDRIAALEDLISMASNRQSMVTGYAEGSAEPSRSWMWLSWFSNGSEFTMCVVHIS